MTVGFVQMKPVQCLLKRERNDERESTQKKAEMPPPPAKRGGKEEKKPEEATEEIGVFVFPDGSRYDGQFVRKLLTAAPADGDAAGGPASPHDASAASASALKADGSNTGRGAAAGAPRRTSTPSGTGAAGAAAAAIAPGTILGDGTPEVAAALTPAFTANGALVVMYRHGNGVYVDGATTYDGQWEHDRMHGFGKLVVHSSNDIGGGGGATTYIGYFANNEFNGRGVFTWPDGSRYDGFWRNNVQHGEGCYTDAAGTRWRGRFYNGVGSNLAEVEAA